MMISETVSLVASSFTLEPQTGRPVEPAPGEFPTADCEPIVDDGKREMYKIFVKGGLLSHEDFAIHWPPPRFQEECVSAVPPFLLPLDETGLIELQESLSVVARHTSAAYLPLHLYDVDRNLANNFPSDVCRRWCILPFDQLGRTLMVATANPFNMKAEEQMQRISPLKLTWYLASPRELTVWIEKIFR